MRTIKVLSIMLIIVTIPLVMLTIVTSCATFTSTDTGQIDVVRSIFPSATEIFEMPIRQDGRNSGRPGYPKISQINGPSGLLGYWVDTEVVSRSGPFKIRVLLDLQCRIKRAMVTSYPWTRGREVRLPEFTNQFKGKGPSDPIQINRDIDAISGATISSLVMTEGVHEIVKLLKDIKENPLVAQIIDSADDIKTLYSKNCSSCHSLIEPGRFTREQWSKYVNEYGKKLTPIEKQHLLQYLIGPNIDIAISAKKKHSF